MITRNNIKIAYLMTGWKQTLQRTNWWSKVIKKNKKCKLLMGIRSLLITIKIIVCLILRLLRIRMAEMIMILINCILIRIIIITTIKNTTMMKWSSNSKTISMKQIPTSNLLMILPTFKWMTIMLRKKIKKKMLRSRSALSFKITRMSLMARKMKEMNKMMLLMADIRKVKVMKIVARVRLVITCHQT